MRKQDTSMNSDATIVTDFDLEIVRAEVTTKEFEVNKERRGAAFLILAMLMLVQISSLLTKFIISAAYNYEGKNTGDPKYDITVAFPNFTFTKYTEITGLYYSLTYGAAALIAGKISDKFQRKKLLTIVCILWNLTSLMNMVAKSFGMLAAMRMFFGLFSAFCSPTCYSLIADYFPPEKRTIANALFTSASFLGIGMSSLCNMLVGKMGWRMTYGICGIYGFFAACMIVLFLEEPERGRYDAKKETIKEEIEEEEKLSRKAESL